MTENKRFTYEYDEYNGNLFDNKYGTFYHIEDNEKNIELLCDNLNELNDKKEMLIIECKHQNKQKRNLKYELKRLGYSQEKIRDIANR